MTTAIHKLRYKKGCPDGTTFPLKRIPIVLNKLHSPVVGNAHGVAAFDTTKYEEYLKEVISVTADVARGRYPYAFLHDHFPKAWGTMESEIPEILQAAGADVDNPVSCANLVRMDLPNDLARFIFAWLLPQAPKLRNNVDANFPFLKLIPGSQAACAAGVNAALQKAFEVKYFYGIARPAEVFEAIYGLPANKVEIYEHPWHPSYVAGHATVAGATAKFFLDKFVLTPVQIRQVRLAAYLFAQYRTFAGVHYAVDNIEGLKLGGLEF